MVTYIGGNDGIECSVIEECSDEIKRIIPLVGGVNFVVNIYKGSFYGFTAPKVRVWFAVVPHINESITITPSLAELLDYISKCDTVLPNVMDETTKNLVQS